MPPKNASVFAPVFAINTAIQKSLAAIEQARLQVNSLPLAPRVLASLRQTARLHTTHYSTMIEGNRLTVEQVQEVLEQNSHLPGRQRDEHEVRGYYAALTYVERWAASKQPLTEELVQTIHGLVMGGGAATAKPSPYRDGQNVIRDGSNGRIVYLPPEAKDVPTLMADLIAWINAQQGITPCPVIAAITHYQCATIHPYFDGNGRTARLLTTGLLHRGGYGLKGVYALDEYYAIDLPAYYEALTVGPSHNYYLGRAEADITSWVAYFCHGMAVACRRVAARMEEAAQAGTLDQTKLLNQLDVMQRKVIMLAQKHPEFTAAQVAKILRILPRTAAAQCSAWVDDGFLLVANSSRRLRSYKLSPAYESLLVA